MVWNTKVYRKFSYNDLLSIKLIRFPSIWSFSMYLFKKVGTEKLERTLVQNVKLQNILKIKKNAMFECMYIGNSYP